MTLRPTIVLLLLLGSLVACSSVQPIAPDSAFSTNVVRMDRDGSPIDLEGKRTGIQAFKNKQLTKITSAIKESATHSDCTGNCAKPTIAIYVHGAPLLKNVGVQEVRQKLRAMRSTNANWFPIVFNWQGTFFDVYVDHLFRIRNGRRISTFRGASTLPFYLVGDVLTSAARAPGTWFDQLVHIVETEYPQFDTSGTTQDARERQALAVTQLKMQKSGPRDWSARKAGTGDSCENPLIVSDTPPKDPKFSPATPAQFIIEAARKSPHVAFSPLIASLGTSMWKNYNRRAQASVRQGKEYERETESTHVGDETPTGAFAVLLDELIEQFKTKNKESKIILIGHSTGTIVISEYIGTLLARHGIDVKNGDGAARRADHLKGLIDEIVFLGSAATIGQFNKTIVPYLRNSEDTKFYNISLNGYDEAKTSWRGFQTMSLLEWLDSAVARPASHAERVMGKWENMMLAMHTIPCEIRSQVHLKHLPSKDGFPRSHSELDEVLDKFSAFERASWVVE